MKRLFKGEVYRLTGYGIGDRLRYNLWKFFVELRTITPQLSVCHFLVK
ncbi:MAG: hypothetical protein LBJ00_01115 [Planctomycetaceae bacterium]|nr:hypothetical protein [Planctomycetaceae bacterium]